MSDAPVANPQRPLGFEAKVRKSLTEGYTILGVQRELFIFFTALMLLLTWALVNKAPWWWLWSVVVGALLWGVGLLCMIKVQKADPQWGEILVDLALERDSDHA